MLRLPLLVAAVTVASVATAGAVCPAARADTTLPPCPQTGAIISPKATSPHTDCRMHSGALDFAVTYWNTPEWLDPRR